MDTRPTTQIREVFDYINRFKGQVFVLKIEDDLLEAPLFPLLIKDIVLIKNMGIQVILVPGAKNSIDKVMKTYKRRTKTVGGIRVTNEKSMPLVKLGASNVANAILTHLSENGSQGVLGNWVRALEMGVVDGVDFMQTGKIESLNIPVIQKLLQEDLIPIISNIGWNAAGKPYNISSNSLALRLTQAIKASKLFFIGKHKGIPLVKTVKIKGLETRPSGVYSSMETGKAEQLLSRHKKDMKPAYAEYVEMAVEACNSGANRVHVIDGSQDGILLQEIFSTNGVGTMFHSNVHAGIRQATPNDISGILHLMQPYVESGHMIQRTADEIASKLGSFYVYSVDDTLHGCGALTTYSNKTAEIEAVVVDSNNKGLGTGKKIVSYLQLVAKEKKIKKVFVLTTQAGDYFMNLGFQKATKDLLPLSRKKQYNKDRNSRVLIKRL